MKRVLVLAGFYCVANAGETRTNAEGGPQLPDHLKNKGPTILAPESREMPRYNPPPPGVVGMNGIGGPPMGGPPIGGMQAPSGMMGPPVGFKPSSNPSSGPRDLPPPPKYDAEGYLIVNGKSTKPIVMSNTGMLRPGESAGPIISPSAVQIGAGPPPAHLLNNCDSSDGPCAQVRTVEEECPYGIEYNDFGQLMSCEERTLKHNVTVPALPVMANPSGMMPPSMMGAMGPSGPPQMFVDSSDGTKVQIYQQGAVDSGISKVSTVILLLHGHEESHRIFANLGSKLANKINDYISVYTYDQRFYNSNVWYNKFTKSNEYKNDLSDENPDSKLAEISEADFNNMLNDFAAVLKHLNQKHTGADVIVYAYGMGGLISARALQTNSEVSGLVNGWILETPCLKYRFDKIDEVSSDSTVPAFSKVSKATLAAQSAAAMANFDTIISERVQIHTARQDPVCGGYMKLLKLAGGKSNVQSFRYNRKKSHKPFTVVGSIHKTLFKRLNEAVSKFVTD